MRLRMGPGAAEKRGDPDHCPAVQLRNARQIMPDLSRILPGTNAVLPSVTLPEALLATTREHEFVGPERRG